MTQVKQYKKKPVIIEAIQWLGGEESCKALDALIGNQSARNIELNGSWDSATEVYIETLEGTMTASLGDYIIKGVKDELYPCKPDIFEQTYEEVNG